MTYSRPVPTAGRFYFNAAAATADLCCSASPVLCRVSDAGHVLTEPRAAGPASESRQGRNPRAMVRGRCRALGYGDLAEAEGVCEGGQCAWARTMTQLVGSRSSGRWLRRWLSVAVAGVV